MTTNEKVARRKLSLLELAKELSNVSRACKIMGYSRRQFYEIRRNYQTYGSEGLLDKLPGCKGPHPNRVAPEIEQAILDFCLDNPTYGPLRVSQELALQGIAVSAVWQRHDLLSKHDRLLRLEKTHREQAIELNDEQIRLLQRFSPEFRERQIEVHYTGEWPWIPSLLEHSRAWARSICKPYSIATAAMPGVGCRTMVGSSVVVWTTTPTSCSCS